MSNLPAVREAFLVALEPYEQLKSPQVKAALPGLGRLGEGPRAPDGMTTGSPSDG
jgi:hypothetical protein